MESWLACVRRPRRESIQACRLLDRCGVCPRGTPTACSGSSWRTSATRPTSSPITRSAARRTASGGGSGFQPTRVARRSASPTSTSTRGPQHEVLEQAEHDPLCARRRRERRPSPPGRSARRSAAPAGSRRSSSAPASGSGSRVIRPSGNMPTASPGGERRRRGIEGVAASGPPRMTGMNPSQPRSGRATARGTPPTSPSSRSERPSRRHASASSTPSA